MGRFDKYATKFDLIIRGALAEMDKAEKAEREAKKELDNYPPRTGAVPAEYQAKQARAKANHLEAVAALKNARDNVPYNCMMDVKELREKLEKALFEGFAANPAAVDMQAVELLKSGILKPDEYMHLVNDALAQGNYTMVRMIAHIAEERAKTEQSEDKARALRAVGNAGKADYPAQYLKAYDDLTDIAKRCINNPALRDQWGTFSRDTLEAF